MEIIPILDDTPICNYKEWKSNRKRILSYVGDILLALDELELNSVYSDWENQVVENSKNVNDESTFKSLLLLSILHYYKRNYGQAKKAFDIILNCLGKSNRDVCKTAAKVLYFISIENSESLPFLRQALELAKSYLSVSQRSKMTYNALVILNKVGIFLLRDVFTITMGHLPEVYNASISNDKEMNILAAKVMKIHLEALPQHSCETYANSLFLDYTSNIASSPSSATIGMVMILRFLFELYPNAIKLDTLIQRLISVILQKDNDAAPEALDFLIELANKSEFSIAESSQISMLLLSQVVAPHPSKRLFEQLILVLKALPVSYIPFSSVLQMVAYFAQSENRHKYHNKAFKVLCNILEINPSLRNPKSQMEHSNNVPQHLVENPSNDPIEVSSSLFDNCICKYSIKALSMLPHIFLDHKEALLKQFGVGINPKASVSDRKTSIRLASTFKTQLFESMRPLFEVLQPNCYSSDEKIRQLMAENLNIFDSEDAMDELVRMATLDTSEKIRLIALRNLTESSIYRNPNLLTQLLADNNIEIRKTAIPIIAKCAEKAALQTISPVICFANDFIFNTLQFTNLKDTAKLCSILPLFAKYFVQYSPPLAPSLAYLCLHYLLGEIPPNYSGFDDLRELVHRHLPAQQSIPTTPNCLLLYIAETTEPKEIRDAYLFDTLGELSETLSPFLSQVIPAFSKAFKQQSSDRLYLSSINALTKIARDTQMSINIPRIFPFVVSDLIQLLATSSHEVGLAALKCTGTMGINDVNAAHSNISEDVLSVDDMKRPSFYTHFVMKALVEMLKTDKSIPVLTAVTSIIVYDTSNCLSFLPDIIPNYVQTLNDRAARESVFSQLEQIAYCVNRHISPFITTLEPYLIQYFKEIECIKLCSRLSHILTSEFTSTASKLYRIALEELLSVDNNQVFKELLKFLDFVILFQHQPIDEFLDAAELICQTNEIHTSFLFKALSLLVQNMTLDIYSSRLARLCFSVLEIKPLYGVQQLLVALLATGNLSISVVRETVDMKCLSKLPIADLERNPQNLVKKQSTEQKPPQFEKQPPLPQTSIFANIPQPAYNNATQWIDDICRNAVKSSSSVAVRACFPILAQNQAFAAELYPVAFVSCWREATAPEKANFSQIITAIIENFTPLEPRVIEFVESVDRSGFPLLVSDETVAKVCERTAHRLYLLEREYMKTKDPQVARQLLELNTRMGRTESARGILRTEIRDMTRRDMGTWSMLLGEWETALDFYQSSNDIGGLISCYGHLEMWDKLRQMEADFEKFDDDMKSQKAIWFAWAFYHSSNNDKVNYYISMFDKNQPNQLSFSAIYYLKTNQYDKAEKCINKAFNIITDDRAVFNGSDERKATVDLAFAEHLVELQEVLNLKKGVTYDVTEIWENRLGNFAHESHSWMNTSEIRSLVLSPEDHLDSYLNMLRVLRKERSWKLADSHLERFFSKRMPPKIMIEELKILWDKGHKKRAIFLISTINELCKGAKTIDNIDLTPENKQLLMKLSCPYTSIDSYTRSRLLRLQATWQYAIYSSKTSSADSLKDICMLFKEANKLRSNDQKTWSGWAYASSRALSHFPEQRAIFAEAAMTGFLKAAKLSPSQSFEYMCQTFSIFFRYGAETGLSDSLRAEFDTLPASTVNMIVSQICVHITDVDETIRSVVQKIMKRFGEYHFQAVVYPLNTLSLIQDKQKSKIATEFLQMLGQKHNQLYKESMLFIDGMHRAAVSWNEYWMTGLDNASRSNQTGDREAVAQILYKLYDILCEPKCQLDLHFLKAVGPQLQKTKTFIERYKAGDENAARAMWTGYREVYQALANRMRRVDTINLNDVSEELAQKTEFSLAVPGMYSITGNSTILRSIDKNLGVMSTQQHPRTAWMTDTKGNRWEFLLKGNEDLRLDQRIIQFFMLINSMLRSNRATGDLGVTIVEYSIVPFAPNAGLISWVTGADTLQQLIHEYRSTRGSGHNIENEISNQIVGPLFNSLNALQRFEVFTHIEKVSKATEIREMLWLRSPSATVWLQRNRCFTVSTAMMSMAGYVIGLGDRHPSNIMIQKHTGKVIHIDFGDSFEVAMNRPIFAERVPFRLTRMIVNALDSASVDGLFKKTCEDVMWVLRDGMSSVMSQLEVFVHEPIFYGKEIRPNERKVRGILERVSSKLAGTDKSEEEQDVHQQVSWLISIASDPKEYIRHYVGWCPFW